MGNRVISFLASFVFILHCQFESLSNHEGRKANQLTFCSCFLLSTSVTQVANISGVSFTSNVFY